MKKLFATSAMALLLLHSAGAADVFRFNAPPGGVYINSSFEQNGTVAVEIIVEHEGAAVPEWFIAVDNGSSAGYEPRQLSGSSDMLNYQIYGTSPPSSDIIKAPPELLDASNIVTSSDFASFAAVTEQAVFTVYFHIPSGQFVKAENYTDTLTLLLYKGSYADSGTHVLADSAGLSVTGRAARLLDIYSIREPGIRFMDLTASVTGKLIATVYERSNSSTGYTVTISSYNLAADPGAAQPFFLHEASAGSLPYSLLYEGSAVGPWTGGEAIITDSAGTTAPEWLTKLLSISYSGSSTLPAGDYQDTLTLIISAK